MRILAALLILAAAPATAQVAVNKPYCGGALLGAYFFQQPAFGFPAYQVTVVNTTNRRIDFTLRLDHPVSSRPPTERWLGPGQRAFYDLGMNTPSEGVRTLSMREQQDRTIITCH